MNSVLARIFCSRKVWIALSAVALCVITVIGADPEKWTPLITAIVTLASVTIAATGYEDGQQKRGAGESGNTSSTYSNNGNDAPSSPPSMNSLALLLLCLSLLGVSQGCTPFSGQPALTPKQAVAALHESYTSTVKVLISARQLGKIDDETAKQIHDARIAANDALDAADVAVWSDDANASDLITQAKTKIDELIEWRIRVESAKGNNKKGGANGRGTSGPAGRVGAGEFALWYRRQGACRGT